MAKLSLTDLTNLQNEQTAVAALNANSAATETALENTLSRDGTAPNTMESTLDMNSHRIINLPIPVSVAEPVSLSYLNSVLAGGNIASGLISGVVVSPFMQGVVGQVSATAVQGALGVRTVLTADANYYVATTGSDANNGTSISTPFLTIQKAVDTIWKTLDLAGFNVTINVAAGLYAGGTIIDGRAVGQTGNSMVTILGNPGNPVSTIIFPTNADAFLIDNGAKVTISGLQPQTAGSVGNCFSCQHNSHLILKSFGVGNSVQYHISTAYNSLTEITNTSYYISGSAQGHYYTTLNSILLVESVSVTLTGSPGFVIAFMIGAVCTYTHIVSTTYSGGATGQRFYMYMNAVYSDGSSQNYSFLPGSTEGTTFGGAVYNNDYEFNSWQNWNPTVATVSGTSATADGQYKSHGKDLYFTVNVRVTAVGSSNSLSIPLPTINNYFNNYTLTAARNNRSFSAVDTTTGLVLACAYITGGSSVINISPPPGAGTFSTHVYTITGVIELT